MGKEKIVFDRIKYNTANETEIRLIEKDGKLILTNSGRSAEKIMSFELLYIKIVLRMYQNYTKIRSNNRILNYRLFKTFGGEKRQQLFLKDFM